jgi:hypothetical protein
MLKEILQKELKLSDSQMYKVRIAYAIGELAITGFIWFTLLTTNPLGSCASQFFIKLGGY